MLTVMMPNLASFKRAVTALAAALPVAPHGLLFARFFVVLAAAVAVSATAALAQERGADAHAPSPSPEAALEADLDTLFAELRAAGAEDYEPVEARIWKRWTQTASPTADLLFDRAREALEAEDPQIAIEHLTALIAHAPGFAEAYNARATAYYAMELFGPAMADIRRTLALNPRHFGALGGLGQILEQLGRDHDALSAYRAAAAIHPHRTDILDGIDRLEKALGGATL